MQVYLVGGAVRDKLLGLPVSERDYVVTGATPEGMIKLGYRQVGQSFPVFLHPKTGDEYALARTERKQGHGYGGFICDFHPAISLEEDLMRRDLTINAMALDEKRNRIIDPYGGQGDLTHKVLRHVSNAFVEDPLRVLRVARFMARFAHLGFRVADETRRFMYDIVRQGELGFLTPERIWAECEKALTSPSPWAFIETLRSAGALKAVLPEIDALFGVPNPLKYHPEIDSGVHTLDVLRNACQLSDSSEVRFAALVHDLGKAVSPIAQWPRHLGHEHAGVPIIQAMAKRLKIPKRYEELACLAARYHLTVHKFGELRAKTILSLLLHADAIRRPERFRQMLLVCEADRLGRLSNPGPSVMPHWLALQAMLQSINIEDIPECKTLSGSAFRDKLDQHRLALIQQYLEKHRL